MKKFLPILMVVLVCIFGLTGCGGGSEGEAYKLYTDMMRATTEEITSMQAKADISMNMEAAGEKMDIKMLMNVSEIIHSETDVEMSMSMSMDMGAPDAKMDVNMYFKDGFMYQEMMGMKVKTKVPLKEATEMVNSDTFSGLDFEKEAMKDSKVENVDGGKQLSFTLDGEKLTGMLDQMVDSMLSSMGTEDVKLKFSDVSYTVLVGSDNLPKEQHIVFDMEIEMEGEKVKASYDMNMTDLKYNSISEISYPSDLDEYTEG